MSLRELLGRGFDLFLRMLPHAAPTGLQAVGSPGRSSPVLVTGNYTLTVRRLRRALAGRDAWVLSADSQGINIWCAATGGHLTHHDVISAVRTSHLDARVDHRELILPQLAATGVEGKKITEATGWSTKWGPVRAEDLPAFLDRGGHVTREERRVPFPLRDRMEMAVMWGFPILLVGTPIFSFLGGWPVGLAFGIVAGTMVFTLYAAIPWIRVTGRMRWATFAAWALGGFGLGAALLAALGAAASGPLMLVALGSVLAMAVLSVDLAGTTPWYGSYINTFRNVAHIDLVPERCTGSATCVLVCPKDVLVMNGPARKVDIVRPADCIQCGACIVQCPTDALRFRYEDNRVVEAATIRTTRMNMLGRRTVPLDDASARGAR